MVVESTRLQNIRNCMENGIVALMSKLLRKCISFALFAIVLANTSAWNFQAMWFTHELDHGTNVALITSSAADIDAHHHDVTDTDELNAPLHQFLHAVDHLQLFPATIAAVNESLPHDPVLAGVPVSSLHALVTESPFRPPRIIPSLV